MSAKRVGNDVIAEVVVDVFERGSGVPAALQRLETRVVVEPLAAGDYRIGGGVLVERKTVADLHGSLGRGRLWAQIGRIRDASVFPLLLLEGDELDAGPVHPNAIRGALLAVAELGVAVLRSRDPADSALWLHRLAVRQARKEFRRSRPREAPSMTPPGVDVLAAVPGISTQTARALLARFGSIGGMLVAGPERWAEVEGIGGVRAHALASALLNGNADR
jgi:ERCC4-type nuclease